MAFRAVGSSTDCSHQHREVGSDSSYGCFFSRLSFRSGVEAGGFASVDVTCGPRRFDGVTIHREAQRASSEGDRVRFSAPDRKRHIAHRELATIERIDAGDNVRLRLHSGRVATEVVSFSRRTERAYFIAKTEADYFCGCDSAFWFADSGANP